MSVGTLLAGLVIGAAVASGVWIVYVHRIGVDLKARAEQRKPVRIGKETFIVLRHHDYMDLACPRRPAR